MRRSSFFSPLGLMTSVLLLTGLGMTLWRSGGKAFSPGRLSAMAKPGVTPGGFRSHAEFESECRRCHLPLKTTQDALCLACHDEIGLQISSGARTHGHIRQVGQCAACHSDHKGYDFDPTRSAYAYFDHSATAFSLAWHQVGYDTRPIDCFACHSDGTAFSTTLEGCVSCHATEDFEFIKRHSADFGFGCLLCHDGSDPTSGFDHQATSFPLDGKHVQTACTACHTQVRSAVEQASEGENILQVFRQSPSECTACHQEPALHAEVFPANCESCHATLAWSPATLAGRAFDHTAQAGFSLAQHRADFSGQAISCRACHPADINAFEVSQCIACHEQEEANPGFMAEHQAQYGSACLDCHDGEDRMRGFRHEDRFPLQGRHAEIACQDCHAGQRYVNTPGECAGCHAEPAVHAGFFGLKCQYCHGVDAWSPARLNVHSFPVRHGDQDGSDCKACHQERYTAYTCYACHQHQPEPIQESHRRVGVTVEALPACADCHPSGEAERGP